MDAAGEPEASDKQTLAVEALMAGCPGAFIDFFYLVTAGDGVADDNLTPDELEARLINPDNYEERDEVPPESMRFLKDSLVSAEESARRGDNAATGEAYRSLARFFAGSENPKKAVFFFDKCLEVAVASGEVTAEIEANANLGGAHEAVGGVHAAIAAYEKQTELAEVSGDTAALVQGRTNLVRVYRSAADTRRAAGDHEGSVRFLEKCLEVAKKDALDPAAEGLANYRLGAAHHAAGDFEKVVTYQMEYLRLCKATGNKEGEGAARRALAAANEALGDVDAAIENLEAFLAVAKTGDPTAHARACCSLGKIYLAQGKHDNAVVYFERFFEVARGLNDRRMLDVARVNLGVARGGVRGAAMLKAVTGAGAEGTNASMQSLLQWKNVRLPLDAAAMPTA